LLALLFVSLAMLADRLYLIEIDAFARHLPRRAAGKWGAVDLSSTVGASAGATTVTILILGGLVLGTARHRFAWLVEAIVFALGMGTCFLSGSRQGLVRMAAFIGTYSLKKPAKYFVLVILFLVPAAVILLQNNSLQLRENIEYSRALERQGVLLSDPFSNEGLAGRPELWQEIVDKLNEEPVRWAIGYGIGNYVEYEAASHNMVLRLIQDGGLIELVLVGFLWIRIFRRVWAARHRAWASVALTAGMLTSALTSEIFYPTLSTGWYLGLYVITLQLLCREAEDSHDKN
jgi:O-antigen ligase